MSSLKGRKTFGVKGPAEASDNKVLDGSKIHTILCSLSRALVQLLFLFFSRSTVASIEPLRIGGRVMTSRLRGIA